MSNPRPDRNEARIKDILACEPFDMTSEYPGCVPCKRCGKTPTINLRKGDWLTAECFADRTCTVFGTSETIVDNWNEINRPK